MIARMGGAILRCGEAGCPAAIVSLEAVEHARMQPPITLHEPARADELRVVDDGLDGFNASCTELQHVRALHVMSRDAEDRVIGGAVGRTWGRCCELLQLWVHDDHRGRGLGTRLMTAFETEARQRGCELVYLCTFSFQAPDFYARLGYEPVLRIAGFTGGITRLDMHKRLQGPALA
jgi:GNAT superfamily N-acetyltransferase